MWYGNSDDITAEVFPIVQTVLSFGFVMAHKCYENLIQILEAVVRGSFSKDCVSESVSLISNSPRIPHEHIRLKHAHFSIAERPEGVPPFLFASTNDVS